MLEKQINQYAINGGQHMIIGIENLKEKINKEKEESD